MSVGTTYNKNVNDQSNVTVAVNATDPTALDWTDGGSPCATHSADGWSSAGLWTDVKVREGNIGTLFGSFGISLPQIAAQARVKVEPIIGVATNGLPFIAETGDQIECVWAQFVRARDGSTTGFTVTPSNPIPLDGDVEPHVDRDRDVIVQFTNAADDVAIRYWAGSKNGAPRAPSPNGTKEPLPHDLAGRPARSRSTGSTSTTPAPCRAHWTRRSFGGSRSPRHTCGGPGLPVHRRHRALRDVHGRLHRRGRHRREQRQGRDHGQSGRHGRQPR